ncbi:hypothetical protein LEP1GSC188_4270 [Leptospira weilii serovar Topaz str. LT2116]|uniref:Uncharacterized protein n=1 Tax=Leptospira weilii serovar Topaz str. LT2116 TaxID=1088540 RepID=M3H3V7_9LEPT|nr:hypothetical protein LEP1GSC188_4270 [Leptospira weilii serovar Topaz str. LT2116]
MEKEKNFVFETPDHRLNRTFSKKGVKYGSDINILRNRRLFHTTKNKLESKNTFELSSKKKSEILAQPE